MDNHIALVRKDVAYSQLSAEKQTNLPCEIELTDADLEAVYGGSADAGVLGTLGDLGVLGVLGNTSASGAQSFPKGSSNPAAPSNPGASNPS